MCTCAWQVFFNYLNQKMIIYNSPRYYFYLSAVEWMSWLSGVVFLMAVFPPSVSAAFCFQVLKLLTSLFGTAMVTENKRFCNLSSHTKLQNLSTAWIDSKTACNSVPPTCPLLTTFIRNSVGLRREKIETKLNKQNKKIKDDPMLRHVWRWCYLWGNLFESSLAFQRQIILVKIWKSIFPKATWGSMCRWRGRRTQSVMVRQVHSWHILSPDCRGDWHQENCTSDWKWQTIQHFITDIYRL